MGNSFPNNMYKHVGTNTRIEFSREDFYVEEKRLEKRFVKYVDSSVVALSLVRTYGRDGDTKLLRFQFVEPIIITFIIDRADNNLLNQTEIEDFGLSYDKKFEVTKKNRGGGGVTKLKVLYRMNEYNGNFIVVEEKRRSGVEKPWAVTLAHYYANSSRGFFYWKKYDVGLSMVVDIKVLNNNLDVSVKGPSEHPPFVLLHMFQQVSMTRTWNWTACPQSASETEIRQHSGANRQQFDTETENDDEERYYPQRPRQMRELMISNAGVIRGNYNGNIIFNLNGNSH